MTAKELWLTILKEAFCPGSFHLRGLNSRSASIAVTCIGDIPQWVERSVWDVAFLMATQ